jgi:hypothetical protein
LAFDPGTPTVYFPSVRQRLKLNGFKVRQLVAGSALSPDFRVFINQFGPIHHRDLGLAHSIGHRHLPIQPKLHTDEDQATKDSEKPDYLHPVIQFG